MANARYDKYVCGFRALLAADWTDVGTPTGVGLDNDGQVVAGAGNTGIVGVLVADSPMHQGDTVDVLADGEIADVGSLAAGTAYYAAAADGTLSTTNTDVPVGFTAEATRLVVRVAR